MEELAQLWRSQFNSTPPLGYILRDVYKERWTRFHAMPNSKRYAETEQEMGIILQRANILAKEILNSDECYLLLSSQKHCYSPRLRHAKAIETFNLEEAFSWVIQDEDDDTTYEWVTYAMRSQWDPEKFSSLLKDLANHREHPALWLSSETLEIFAPYDGGFDIICKNYDRVSQLQNLYSEWMSERSDKL